MHSFVTFVGRFLVVDDVAIIISNHRYEHFEYGALFKIYAFIARYGNENNKSMQTQNTNRELERERMLRFTTKNHTQFISRLLTVTNTL